MKRIIKVSSSYTGVLPTAEFSNVRPSFGLEEQFEVEVDSDIEAGEIKEKAMMDLFAICKQAFSNEADNARILKIKQDLKNFRFYPVDGEQFPSVTSVAGYDKEFFVGDEDLKLYASQGNIIDAEIRNFVNTGVWKNSEELLECTADRFILKSRRIASGRQLALSGWDFQGFLKKYPIENLKSIDKPVFNRQYRYAGTPDLIGEYLGLKTLVSIKRTKSETDNLIQESAYANCEGMEDIKQMMVVEMKAEEDGGNKSGYSKPIVSTEIPKYFELFLMKRSEVKKIYGV